MCTSTQEGHVSVRRVASLVSGKPTPGELVNLINSSLGKGTVMLGSDPSLKVEYLATGVMPIDALLEGGLPRGRWVEIYGNFSTLKSYVALCAIAETQKIGGTCVLIDTEHAYDHEWAAQIGVDTERLIVEHPPTGEEAVDVTQVVVANGADLVVWDSVAAILPKQEANIRMGGDKNIQPARLAALMSAALRKITAGNSKTALLCINQTRQKVGIVFGNPETTPGGMALPFYASYRMAMRRVGSVTTVHKVWTGDKYETRKTTVGQKVRCELTKSKLSKPEQEVFFVWDNVNARVNTDSFLLSRGLELGLLQMTTTGKGKRQWRIKNTRISHLGDQALLGWLESNPEKKAWLAGSVLAGKALPVKSKVASRRRSSLKG